MSLTVTTKKIVNISLFPCRVCKVAPSEHHAVNNFYPVTCCTIMCPICGVNVSSKSRGPGCTGVTELRHYQEASDRWNKIMEP